VRIDLCPKPWLIELSRSSQSEDIKTDRARSRKGALACSCPTAEVLACHLLDAADRNVLELLTARWLIRERGFDTLKMKRSDSISRDWAEERVAETPS
jgi:hypothetical protein